MSRRRTFGSARQLPSGRWQVRYYLGNERVSLPETFETRKLAEVALAKVAHDQQQGVHVGPQAGKERLTSYAKRWMAERDLADRTRELYRSLLEHHILPTFGDDGIGEITPSRVRTWNARLSKEHATTAAKAYRLLRTILGTAVTDDLIARNPCRVERAGVERSPERPVASLAEVDKIVQAVPERFRALVLVATWCQLRRGELLGLRRRDVDLMHNTITVVQTKQRLQGGRIIFKEPKSRAGRRKLAIPPNIIDALSDHLERFVDNDPDALVFTGEKGGPLAPQQFGKYWNRARLAAGRPDLHLHDLRHTGNTWAAATGASTKELMARMGHDSPRAALIYQHATEDRDRVIADALAELVAPAEVVPLRKLGHD